MFHLSRFPVFARLDFCVKVPCHCITAPDIHTFGVPKPRLVGENALTDSTHLGG